MSGTVSLEQFYYVHLVVCLIVQLGRYIPWYRDSSLSSRRNFARTSGGSTAGASLVSVSPVSFSGISADLPSAIWLSPSLEALTSEAASGVSARGVPDLMDSSSPMVNSPSNSLGSGPRTGVPVLRLGREDWLRPGGRRAELERSMLSWADF